MATHASNTPSWGMGQPIDVDKLIETRLLIQANSGGGKSWAIRRLAEQAYAHVPQIILDVEGEFHTLRERYDYVLAGQRGDCPADLKSAALLARRLLELNVSAVIDIYELGAQRARFVALFLDALVNAPRELWHSLIVVVDEAHLFCPEAGHAESAAAVIDLMTRGRKRGFCGVLATQRIAKLHKDAAAECNNKLIGRSALDIDMKRAGAELGFTTREDVQQLRTLPAGTFYGFGPAIAETVTPITIGAVHTTHPKAGARAALPTPPRAKIKQILAQLADLPAEADAEARTVHELRLKVKQLETERQRGKTTAPAQIVEKTVLKDATITRLDQAITRAEALCTRYVTVLGNEFKRIEADLHATRTALQSVQRGQGVHVLPVCEPPRNAPTQGRTTASTGIFKVLPIGETAVLRALIQYPNGLPKKSLTVLTSYKRSTRDAYLQRLREKGYVTDRGDHASATPAGVAALPDVIPLPTGVALRAFWLNRLPSGERRILEVLLTVPVNHPINKSAIDQATAFKRSTRDAYLSRLAAKELVEDLGGGYVKASPTLWWE